MKFCEQCGKELNGELFCTACGNKATATTENPTETEATLPSQQPIQENTENVINVAVPKPFQKNILMIAAAAVIAIIVLIVLITKNSGPNFKKLYSEHCISTWAELGSDESYLSIDTNPYDFEDSGIFYQDAYYAIETINEELKLPDSLFEDMGSTTGADGKQTEEFNNVTVSWKYHPDSGLEVIYKKK